MMTTCDKDWIELLMLFRQVLGIVVLGLLVGLWFIHPFGVEMTEVVQQSRVQESFFAGYVP